MYALTPPATLDFLDAGRPASWDFFSATNRQDLIEDTGLTQLDFFHAARWTYHRGSEAPPHPFTLAAEAFDPNAGFYGAALKVDRPGETDQIVIAFEGTDPSSETLRKDPVFLAGQLEADAQIYFGQIPEAFTDALTFTQGVLETAEAQGIPRENVYVTGHSLGGAEAEYVAAQLDLGGATFGAPGIHASAIPEGSTPDLINYVVYGDPVGNYSADPPNRLSNILFSDDILHFGEIKYIGSPVGGLQLDAANALLAPNRTDAEKLAGLGLLADAVKYHLIPSYEDALQQLAGADTLVDGLFANQSISLVPADLWA
jgi:hypothetical protein